MPINLKASLKPLVRLKRHETCSVLKRHFEDGVLREVVGAWEAQLRKYPNDKNFLWVDIPWTVLRTVKGHNKKVSFGGRASHGRWMVEQAYLVARQLGIISRPFETEINGVIRRGFILTPHNALCVRTKVGCRFIGPYQVPGTSWSSEHLFRDEKPSGKTTIIFKGFLDQGNEQGKDEGNEEGKDQGKENRFEEGQGKSLMETAESTTDSRTTEGDLRTEIPYIPLKPVSPSKPIKPTKPEPGDYADEVQKQEPSQKQDDSTPLVHSLTNQEQNHTVSVAQYFQNAEKSLISLVTYGELLVKPNGRKNEYWELENALRQAVKDYGDDPLTDRKVLGGIMNRAIGLTGHDAPKPFFKLMMDFKEHGGRVISVKRVPPPEPPRGCWDIEYESFREAWQKLHALLESSDEKPAAQIKLRDEWYERDATPNKPPKPW